MGSVAAAVGGEAEIIVLKVVTFSRSTPPGLQFYSGIRTDPIMMQEIQ